MFSLAHLGQYVFTALGSALAWVLVVSSIVFVLDLSVEPRDPLPIAISWLLALLTATYVVYVSDEATFA